MADTGGIPNFNIRQLFESFGYTPSQAEIDSFGPAFGGTYNMGETGTTAIANYVQAMKTLEPALQSIQGNLLSEQEASTNANNLGQILETQGTDAYNKAAAIYTQAPQLFGSLTPDQIQQYIAPITQATQQQLGQVTGQMASRGLGGSSIEANAMAQNQALYQQNVLQTGLGIGQQQQQNQANALIGLGGQQFGAGQQQYGLGAQYAGLAQGSAGQQSDLSSLIAGLPSQFTNQALGQNAALQALRPQTTSPLGGYLGTGLGFLLGGPMGANYGGNIASAVTGNPMGANLGAAINPLSGILGTNQGGNSTSGMNSLGNVNILSQLMKAYGGLGGGTSAAAAGGGTATTSGITSGLMAIA